MIPDKSDPRWKDILTGKIDHHFRFVAAGMCVSRNMRSVEAEKTQENMQRAVTELHTFFTKYEQIAKDDLETVFG
jgi:hypothetical protein